MTWEQKLRLDVLYVDHQTLLLDLRILVRTVTELISSQGRPAMESLSRTAANELEFRGDGPPGNAGSQPCAHSRSPRGVKS